MAVLTPDTQNPEWDYAYQLATQTDRSFFLTGRAGTGKSTFLRHLVEHGGKELVVLAPTGVAAMNVQGSTIHSFFGLPLRPLLPEDQGIKAFWRNSPKRKIVERMDTLVIDEVSMVRCDIMDAIDFSLRKNLRTRAPFGGKQVILIGDLFQLEPVARDLLAAPVMMETYESPYFFDSRVLQSNPMERIELRKVYRQRDRSFVDLLDRVRQDGVEPEDLEAMRARVRPSKEHVGKGRIMLCTTNRKAGEVNDRELAKLPGNEFSYKASIEGDFGNDRLPAELELRLKKGAQVMFLRNDPGQKWANGTIGVIQDISEETIEVQIEGGDVVEVNRASWNNYKIGFDSEKNCITQEETGTFRQYPLRLAWAITIHKSQGLTFDKVTIDLGRGAFSGGQTYVALSRCRTLEGIALTRQMNPADVFVNERIIEVMHEGHWA